MHKFWINYKKHKRKIKNIKIYKMPKRNNKN